MIKVRSRSFTIAKVMEPSVSQSVTQRRGREEKKRCNHKMVNKQGPNMVMFYGGQQKLGQGICDW